MNLTQNSDFQRTPKKNQNICFVHIFYFIRAPRLPQFLMHFIIIIISFFPRVLFIFFFRFCSPPPLCCHVMMDKCNKTQRGIQKTKTLYFPSFFFPFFSFFVGKRNIVVDVVVVLIESGPYNGQCC